jgi:Zn-dependent protease
VLVFSVILHEVAHGYMANWLGDPTARLQGRLTLNPFKHIDPLGSVVLPLIMVLGHFMPIGYAKPVPYNPYNLKGKYAEGWVAFAGPGVNIFLAVVFGLLLRFGQTFFDPALQSAFATICIINLSLAAINLIPIPPIDGSKILSNILLAISPALEDKYRVFRDYFDRLGIFSGVIGLLILLYLFQAQYAAALIWSFMILTGLSF